MAREVDQIARGCQDTLGSLGDFAPDIGQHHVTGPALDHGDAERPLKVANLHRQSGLGHGAGLGRTAKMAVLGERGEITKLSKGDHRHQIN